MIVIVEVIVVLIVAKIFADCVSSSAFIVLVNHFHVLKFRDDSDSNEA